MAAERERRERIAREQRALDAVEAVVTQLADGPRRLLRAAAHEWDDGETFTLAELAAAAGEAPAEPPLLEPVGDGGEERYRLPADARAALRELLL